MADVDFSVLWGSIKRKLVDMLDGTWAERVIAQPPAFLLTGTTRQRLRVDVGEAGFFEGRQARTFREFSIGAGTTLTLKFVVPVNIILLFQGVELDAGSIRIINSVGGTPAGTFSETLPVVPKNTMTERPTPLYVPQVVVTAGGSVSGFTTLDIHRVVAATATAQQSTVGNVVGDERGIAANTYHVSYENFGSGSATGTLFFLWEERP
ncbi:hypothetical protein D3C85_871770 [compost metagenome]